MLEDTNQKLTGYNESRGFNYIKLHVQKYNLLMNTFITKDLSCIGRLLILLDFIGCVIKYGAGINDYFQYNFYKRKSVDRKNFIVGRKWIQIVKKCNGTIEQPDFDDKSKFNVIFKDFLKRDWIDLDTCSREQYEIFIDRHPISMYKVKSGSGGNGIGIINFSVEGNRKFLELKSKHLLLEELIEQHKEMAEFNPASVNTLRLVTLVCENNVKLMNAVFRCGNGDGKTDNFHHYGLAALIDCQSGVVVTPGVDKKNNKCYFHPKTGKQIIGFHIPYWEKIVNTVQKAALVRPQIRYVGWDVSINSEGEICIIEGNCASDPDITQMPDQIGKWPLYKDLL